MMRFEFAAATDTGRVRETNEDAFYLGDSILAVADGMGGHAAGEVASATALEPVARLDGKVFPDAEAALSSLAKSVVTANRLVVAKAADDPSYQGMGTTLTAAMLEGRRVHFAHVGDSRAYLLRNGEFSQLTRDHTLVQHLVEEGEITPEEAEHHPQRSIITRAIGVQEGDIDVDTMSLDLVPGDQILLCSDGLTGVVDDEQIARRLLAAHETDDVVDELIADANDAGGPDNITIVLLRTMTEMEEPEPVRDETSTLEPGPEHPITRVSTTPPPPEGDWASRLGRFGSLGREKRSSLPGENEATGGPGWPQRAIAILIGLGILLGVAIGGGRWLLSRSYYVGVEDERVAIYQGVPTDLGPISLSWVSEVTDLTVEAVPEFYRDELRDGIPAADLTDARRIIASAPRVESSDTDPDDGATEDRTPEPTETPRSSPSP